MERIPAATDRLPKLLSHRLRGFGDCENAGAALRAACGSGVPWLEVDTRVSADGVIFLHHDPTISLPADPKARIAETRWETLGAFRHPDGEPLLSLADALQLFAQRGGASQRFCIDIKDYGFESEHVALVRELGLENKVCFVSWIPQTIQRLHELGTSCPLILSYCSTFDLGPLGPLIDRWLARRTLRMGPLVALGQQSAQAPLDSLSHGFQHAFFCSQLQQPLLAAVGANHGGVCVQRRLVGPHLMRYCNEQGIQLWTFSVRTKSAFIREATRPDVDVVFCDDAPRVLREMTS